jgi:regulatory protein
LQRAARPASLGQRGEEPGSAGPASDPLDLSDASALPPKPDRALLRAAVAMLARRDFARTELCRRLVRKSGGPPDLQAVERVLDHLQAKGLLSEQRFTREFVRARAGRFGPLRLRHELLARGVDEAGIEAALRAHQGDEYATALALWSKRFKQAPSDARERARQGRFLAARGFSHHVIRRVLALRP